MDVDLSLLGPAALGAFVGMLASRSLIRFPTIASGLPYVILASVAGFILIYLFESFSPSPTQIVFYALALAVAFVGFLGRAVAQREEGPERGTATY